MDRAIFPFILNYYLLTAFIQIYPYKLYTDFFTMKHGFFLLPMYEKNIFLFMKTFSMKSEIFCPVTVNNLVAPYKLEQ